MTLDHYKVLEVAKDASAEEIQRAYRTLALRYHPDRNSAPDAATRMTAINEAWEALGDQSRRREYDALSAKPVRNAEITACILLAAREVVLRGGWRVLEDNVRVVVVENARQRLRVAFLERIDNTALLRMSGQHSEFFVALAVCVEGPIQAGQSAAAIDLMRSERHGAPLPEGPSRSLLAAFL